MLEKKEVTLDRKKLYEEIWDISLSTVAKKYDVPYNKLKAACQNSNIPLPTSSYWGDKGVGKKTIIPELPDSESKEVTISFSKRYDGIPLKPAPSKVEKTEETKPEAEVKHVMDDGSLDFIDEKTRLQIFDVASKITIDPNRKLHKVLAKHKVDYKSWKANHPRDVYANWRERSWRCKVPDGEPAFWESVSEETLPRLYIILNAVFGAIESLGGKVNDDLSVAIRNEVVYFSATETKEKAPHVMTKEEQAAWDKYELDIKKRGYGYRPNNQRKYDYIPNGKIGISVFGGGGFRDWERKLVENQLGEIVIAFFRASESVRLDREQREAEERRREEERRQEELRRKLIREDISRTEALKNKAEDFAIACSIRNYISALQSKESPTDEELKYIDWAKKKADWYDPSVAYDDPILGKREHGKSKEEKDKIFQRYSMWL